MMRIQLVFTLAVVATIGLAASLLAQQPGGQRGPGGPGGGRGGFPGGGGGFGQSRLSLLRIAEIRKELELADEQIAAIEKADQEIREKYPFGGGRGGPGGPGGPGGKGGDGQKGRRGGNNGQGAVTVPTQWYFVQQNQNQNQQGQGQGRGRGGQPPSPEEQARFEQQRLERTREERARLAEILLPQQLKRLTEIYVQQAGVAALQDEEIAKELGISDAQKAKLAEVRTANQQAMGEQMRTLFQGGGGGGDRDAARAKMDELRKASDAKVLAVLSSDQQKKFEEMKGKPFAMPENAGFGGRGGPGGGQGNRGKGNRGGNNN